MQKKSFSIILIQKNLLINKINNYLIKYYILNFKTIINKKIILIKIILSIFINLINI